MEHTGPSTTNTNENNLENQPATSTSNTTTGDLSYRNNYENNVSINNHNTSSQSSVINGIRMDPTNFQRRTAESSRIIRNNIHLMFEEIRPYVEQARSNLLNRQSSQNSTSSTATNTIETNTNNMSPGPINSDPSVYYNNDYVINIDSVQSSDNNGTSETRQNSVPDPVMTPPSPNNNNSNNNNNEDSTTSDALRHMPEARALLETLQKYVPFVVILSAKAVYDHREGILNLIALFITFSHANSVVKQEVMKQGRRSITALLIVMLYIVGCIIFIDYIFNDKFLYANLIFAAVYTKPLTVWQLLWSVAVTDYMLKLITVIFKIIVILLPGIITPFQRRGKYYLLIESISQFYRSLLPIQPWLWFLLDSYQGAERVMGVLLAAVYMVAKGTDLAAKLKLIKTALHKLIQNVNFGTTATKEQLRIAGEQCPICHDAFSGPVALQPCKHVFCETCVCAWLDREPTCPLCRALVSDDPAWRDGSTTHCIQLY